METYLTFSYLCTTVKATDGHELISLWIPSLFGTVTGLKLICSDAELPGDLMQLQKFHHLLSCSVKFSLISLIFSTKNLDKVKFKSNQLDLNRTDF